MHKFFTVAPKPSALTALPLAQAPRRAVQHACGALGRAPGQDGVFDASLQKPMHNPGWYDPTNRAGFFTFRVTTSGGQLVSFLPFPRNL